MNKIIEFLKQNWRLISIIVAMVILAGAVVKFIVLPYIENWEDDENLNRDDIANQFAPPEDSAETGNNNQSPAPPVIDVRGAPSPTVLGSTTPPTPPFKEYRNDAFSFVTMIPTESQISTNGNELTIKTQNGLAAYWTMTTHDDTTESLASIEAQLRSSPSVSQLVKTTLGGQPALKFRAHSLGADGYAVIYKQRLYYLMGNFSDPELIKHFKFM